MHSMHIYSVGRPCDLTEDIHLRQMGYTRNWNGKISLTCHFMFGVYSNPIHYKGTFLCITQKCFSLRLGGRIEVWLLTQSNGTSSSPSLIIIESTPSAHELHENKEKTVTKVTGEGVIRSSVISGTVIPNCNIMLTPLESNLDIVIMRQQIQKVVQQQITLMFGNIIDVTYMMSHCKHTLPSGHGIGSDNRVNCFK